MHVSPPPNDDLAAAIERERALAEALRTEWRERRAELESLRKLLPVRLLLRGRPIRRAYLEQRQPAVADHHVFEGARCDHQVTSLDRQRAITQELRRHIAQETEALAALRARKGSRPAIALGRWLDRRCRPPIALLVRLARKAFTPSLRRRRRNVQTRLRLEAMDPGDRTQMRIAIVTAVGSARAAPRWGDWHLAQGLATALERLGNASVVLTASQGERLVDGCYDVRLAIRGLSSPPRLGNTAEVLWVVSHPELLDLSECEAANLVLVASRPVAAELADVLTIPVEVVLQATDPRRFHPTPADPRFAHDLVVVANAHHQLRRSVADALAAGLRPAIYGMGWEDLVPRELIVANHIPNKDLPTLYSSAGVILNDHWDTMRACGFVSNRIFDALACGAPVISDHVPEILELFDGAVPTYRDPEELRELVTEALEDPAMARARASVGRRIVLAEHTFDHRARALVELMAMHGITLDRDWLGRRGTAR